MLPLIEIPARTVLPVLVLLMLNALVNTAVVLDVSASRLSPSALPPGILVVVLLLGKMESLMTVKIGSGADNASNQRT